MKINTILELSSKNNTRIVTTDKSISSGKYGIQCGACKGTIFDSLKVTTENCTIFKDEDKKESLCFNNVKRFRIKWYKDVYELFKIFTMPQAKGYPANVFKMDHTDNVKHLISFESKIVHPDILITPTYMVVNNDDECMTCFNYCVYNYVIKPTGINCNQITIGFK